MKFKKLREQLHQKQKELKGIFNEHTSDGQIDMPSDVIADVRARNDELTELGKKCDDARDLEEIRERNKKALNSVNHLSPPKINTKQGRGQGLTLGDAVVTADGYKNWQEGRKLYVNLGMEIDAKATFRRDDGFAPEVTRTGKVELTPTRRPMVADLISSATTTQSAVRYMEEVLFDNQVGFVAEGGTLNESGVRFDERTIPIEKVGHWIPMTNEQLADVPQARTLINSRLVLMIELAEEAALLRGNGTTPNITGFLNKTGVLVQVQGSDPMVDSIFKGMTQVRHTGFAEPSGIIFHPNDWQNIRLLRTTEGIYIWGNPSEPGPERVWGKQAVITPVMTEGIALLGDFAVHASIVRKKGIVVQTSDSHASMFTSDQQAVKGTKRFALCIYRASAFCRVNFA
jgi:HK97 family phage major capsid protein